MCLPQRPRFLCKSCQIHGNETTVIAIGRYNIRPSLFTHQDLSDNNMHLHVFELDETAIYTWNLELISTPGHIQLSIQCPKCFWWIGYIPPGLCTDLSHKFHLFQCQVTWEL